MTFRLAIHPNRNRSLAFIRSSFFWTTNCIFLVYVVLIGLPTSLSFPVIDRRRPLLAVQRLDNLLVQPLTHPHRHLPWIQTRLVSLQVSSSSRGTIASTQPSNVTSSRSNTNTMNENDENMNTASLCKIAILRIEGPDSKGIVAAFAQVLYGHGCNIVDSEQHSDESRFFQRIVFDYTSMHTDRISLEAGIREVCTRFGMAGVTNWNNEPKKMCIMVSKYDHALWELLLRHQAGELPCEIPLIISNHDDLRHIADHFNIRFEVFKITKDTKREQEQKELDLMKSLGVDLVVLARYMQIISDEFCSAYQHSVINIHHSFLPAFIGARPYHRAHARGVKLVGATAHYATADLDEGPIIEQDVARISHRHSVNDLLQKGRVLEREILIRAVKAHLEDRIIVYENKCVVFGD